MRQDMVLLAVCFVDDVCGYVDAINHDSPNKGIPSLIRLTNLWKLHKAVNDVCLCLSREITVKCRTSLEDQRVLLSSLKESLKVTTLVRCFQRRMRAVLSHSFNCQDVQN